MIETANKKHVDGICFVADDCENLPFSDKQEKYPDQRVGLIDVKYSDMDGRGRSGQETQNR